MNSLNSSDKVKQDQLEPPMFASPWVALFFAWRKNGMQRADKPSENAPKSTELN